MINRSSIIVMSFLFLVILLPVGSSLQPDEVTLDAYVNDYAGVLSQNETVALTALLETLHENNTAQMSILVVDSLEGLSKEEYALEIAHENLGGEQSDNGLLVLIAVEERKYRIEVGYGLEGQLNDAKVGRMARQRMVPYLKNDRYGVGLIEFTKGVYVELTGDEKFSGISAPVSLNTQQQAPWWSQLGILPFLVVFMVLRGVMGAISEKSSKKGGSSRHRDADNTFAAAIIASMFMRGGGGGLGGAGGGFGGFGGGGFGGGGAGGGF